MSDFKSLLSTFQAATGTTSNSTQSNNNSSKKKSSKTDEKKSLKEATHHLFQVSNLRRLHNKDQHALQTNEAHVHIAICAVIVDELPHEPIWKQWMETGDPRNNPTSSKTFIKATAEMYIHAKYPEKVHSSNSSTWLKNKTLTHSFRPNWNDVKVVQAILYLFETCLKDSKTTHVLVCTESCIPITTLYEAASTIVLDSNNQICMNRSFINAYHRNDPRFTRFDEHNCWAPLEPHVPIDAIWKALPGWGIYSRKHVTSILNIPKSLFDSSTKEEFYPIFKNVWAPEEVFLPTALALTGDLPSSDIIPKALTYSLWDKQYSKHHKERAHPKVFDDTPFTTQFVKDIRFHNSNQHLFMRKWKKPLNVNLWSNVVVYHKNINQSNPHQSSKKRYRYNDHHDSNHRRQKNSNRYSSQKFQPI